MINELIMKRRVEKIRKTLVATCRTLRGLSEYEDDSGEVRVRVTLDGEPYELTFKRVQEVWHD
jgi:hypothetical protein